MNIEWIERFFFAVFRLSTPIIYAALAASICKLTDIMNMAIESMMLCGALGGVIISAITGSAYIGLLGAMCVGVMVALIISYASFIGKADLYLTNIAMNLVAAGATIFILYLLTGTKSNSAGSIKSYVLPSVSIPLVENIPFLGNIISGHHILTYFALALPFIVNFFIYRTRLGLRLRSVGENANAAESVGISVTKIRFISFSISGALAGIGGAYLSMGYMSAFLKNMTAGRGYIGFSANNMVAGSPIGSLFSSLIFGIADVIANALQMTQAPADFVLMLPYAATIFGLVVISVIRRHHEQKLLMKNVHKEGQSANSTKS
jgi:simple sugar transport system permease protein